MIKVWSYCAADWYDATRAAGGVKPFACPDEDVTTIGPQLVKATEADIVYLNLHGFQDRPHLYGQQNGRIGPTALTAEEINLCWWQNVVVFAEVCYGAADGGGPIARAFLDNGARAFIGSTTEAYGRMRPTIWDGEADRLMLFFRMAYAAIRKPGAALRKAKMLLRWFSYPLDADDRKTIDSFICLSGGDT